MCPYIAQDQVGDNDEDGSYEMLLISNQKLLLLVWFTPPPNDKWQEGDHQTHQ